VKGNASNCQGLIISLDGDKVKYALKLYYDGKKFFGSQKQPNKRTVEGELLKALEKFDPQIKEIQSAGRTDRGVSSLGNVFAVSSDSKLQARALNNFLPKDIRVLAVKEVEEDFNPRYDAIERVYKYFLYDEGYRLEKMKEGAQLLKGKHSFHNFCIEENRDPVRKINMVDIDKIKDFLVITISGESFLWQMVRRIVTALKMIGSRELDIDELKKRLDPSIKSKFPPSPPKGLVLWDVKYPFKFEYERYSLEIFIEEIFKSYIDYSTEAFIREEIVNELCKFK
jgi:tRNA pseudouridine38-40 synthase